MDGEIAARYHVDRRRTATRTVGKKVNDESLDKTKISRQSMRRRCRRKKIIRSYACSALAYMVFCVNFLIFNNYLPALFPTSPPPGTHPGTVLSLAASRPVMDFLSEKSKRLKIFQSLLGGRYSCFWENISADTYFAKPLPETMMQLPNALHRGKKYHSPASGAVRASLRINTNPFLRYSSYRPGVPASRSAARGSLQTI